MDYKEAISIIKKDTECRHSLETCDKKCANCGYMVSEEDFINALETICKHNTPRKPDVGDEDTWGVKKTAFYCPNCGYQLTEFKFIGDGTEKVTYCEICLQAIDWDWREK